MELKLQLVATAGGGSLSSFSSPGTPGDVSDGGGIENAVRKSDQRSKPKTTVKHKHGRKVAKSPPQKFPLALVFMLPNNQDEQPSLGLLSSQNGTQRLRLGLSSVGGEVVVGGCQ